MDDSRHQAERLMQAAERVFPSRTLVFDCGPLAVIDLMLLIDGAVCAARTPRQAVARWVELLPLFDLPVRPQLRHEEHLSLLHLHAGHDDCLWLCLWLLLLGLRLDEIAGSRQVTQLTLPLQWRRPLHELCGRLPLVPHWQQGFSLQWRQTLPPREGGQDAQGRALVNLLQQLTPRNPRGAGVVDRVKRRIGAATPLVTSLQEIAAAEGMSHRTLQRKLRDSGSNFEELLRQVRYELALKFLADPQLTIRELATLLGFKEQSSFNHAFLGWHGSTPMAARRVLLQQAEVAPGQRQPVRLHYAVNYTQYHNIHAERGGCFWIQVDNIGFIKQVRVAIRELDGIWRHYPATFHRFLADGVELWATANLCPASPFTFALHYQVGGEEYVDDNGGAYYHLAAEERVLLGAAELVVSRFHLFGEGSQPLLCLAGYVRRQLAVPEVLVDIHDGDRHWRQPAVLGQPLAHAIPWSLVAPVSSDQPRVTVSAMAGERLLAGDRDLLPMWR